MSDGNIDGHRQNIIEKIHRNNEKHMRNEEDGHMKDQTHRQTA